MVLTPQALLLRLIRLILTSTFQQVEVRFLMLIQQLTPHRTQAIQQPLRLLMRPLLIVIRMRAVTEVRTVLIQTVIQPTMHQAQTVIPMATQAND